MKTWHLVLTAFFLISQALTASADQDKAVLVQVNNSQITAEQFKRQLDNFPPDMPKSVVTDEKARREFVDNLIGIELVIQEALKQGLDKTEEFKKNQEVNKQNLEKARDNDVAKKEKMLEESTRNQLFNRQYAKALAGKRAAIPPPTNEEIVAYYREHADTMVGPDGKKLTLHEVAPQLRQRVTAEKQRALYLEYVKSLRATASISIDENALAQVIASLSKTYPGKKQTAPAKKQAAPEEKPEEHASTAAASAVPLAWVDYCSGKPEYAVIVDSIKAKEMSRGKAAFCVEHEGQGTYDPHHLEDQCHSEGPRPEPWASTDDVILIVTLPAGSNPADYEVVVTVSAPEAPDGCASCDPFPKCDANTHDVTRTFRIAFPEKQLKKVWSLMDAMLDPAGREYLKMNAIAVLKKKGRTVAEKMIEVGWGYCC